MEEKGQLKYKVGDRVSFEAVISDVDYSRQAPYRFTYRDGSGLWATKEYLEELTDKLPPRPQVTQKVMDWYEEYYHKSMHVRDVLEYFTNEPLNKNPIASWLYGFDNEISLLEKRQHALATLIAYGPEFVEVEKEKRCLVTLKATGQLLKKYKGEYIFVTNGSFKYLPKQELIEAGFGDVFDNPMFEVEEVE